MTNQEAITIIGNLEDKDILFNPCDVQDAKTMAIKALEQEPTIAQERYEDLCEYFGGAKDILNNREDFKAWLGRIKWHIHKAEELYERYEQEPKTGHWIDREVYDSDRWKCSECGRTEQYQENYCPKCGARMRGESE